MGIAATHTLPTVLFYEYVLTAEPVACGLLEAANHAVASAAGSGNRRYKSRSRKVQAVVGEFLVRRVWDRGTERK